MEPDLVPLDEPAAASPAATVPWSLRRRAPSMDSSYWVRAYETGDPGNDEYLLDVVEALQARGIPVYLDEGEADGALVVLVASDPPPINDLDFLDSISDLPGPLWFLLVTPGTEDARTYGFATGTEPRIVDPNVFRDTFAMAVLADELSAAIRERFTFQGRADLEPLEVWWDV